MSLLSDSGCFAGAFVLVCFLNIENTGRLFKAGEGELRGVGEDGGLDRDGSSEKIAGESFGLDGGGVEDSRAGDDASRICATVDVSMIVVSMLSVVSWTRLRLVGGSSLYRGRLV